jgi:hypothetical protein
MGKTVRKTNTRYLRKWDGYYFDDCDCSLCKFHAGKKHGCRLDNCRCEEEKHDALKYGRNNRKRGANSWDS